MAALLLMLHGGREDIATVGEPCTTTGYLHTLHTQYITKWLCLRSSYTCVPELSITRELASYAEIFFFLVLPMMCVG